MPNAKATDEEIKNSYRRLAKLYHPDLNGGDASLSEKFKDINEAYEILGNAASRKKYDRVHFAYKFRDGFTAENVKSKLNVSSGVNEFFTTFFGNANEKTVPDGFMDADVLRHMHWDEGKSCKEAMIAGLNKFLRIYYGRVTELYTYTSNELVFCSRVDIS